MLSLQSYLAAAIRATAVNFEALRLPKHPVKHKLVRGNEKGRENRINLF